MVPQHTKEIYTQTKWQYLIFLDLLFPDQPLAYCWLSSIWSIHKELASGITKSYCVSSILEKWTKSAGLFCRWKLRAKSFSNCIQFLILASYSKISVRPAIASRYAWFYVIVLSLHFIFHRFRFISLHFRSLHDRYPLCWE